MEGVAFFPLPEGGLAVASCRLSLCGAKAVLLEIVVAEPYWPNLIGLSLKKKLLSLRSCTIL